MGFLSTIAVLIIGFFLWNIWAFLKYKKIERKDKNEISSYILEGMSLAEAIEKTFSNLNNRKDIGLRPETIEKVSNELEELITIMDVSNVVEIYLTFLHRYIFDFGRNMNPKNISDEKIIYAVETLDFNERGGYFVVKTDRAEEIDKKYPD